MIQLNLLPDLKKEFLRSQRMKRLVISIAISATVVAGILTAILATTVYIGQTIVISALDSSIKDNFKKLQNNEEIDKYLTVQNQLNSLDALHNQRYAYANLFDYLQQLNPSDPHSVMLSTASIKKEMRELTLEGTIATFESLNNFKTTLEQAQLSYNIGDDVKTIALFSRVELLQAGMSVQNGGAPRVSFRIRLVYPDEAFIATATKQKITIPNRTLSDAAENAPKAVFGGSN